MKIFKDIDLVCNEYCVQIEVTGLTCLEKEYITKFCAPEINVGGKFDGVLARQGDKPPVVEFIGEGSGAEASFKIVNGQITDLTLVNAGYGFSSAPDVQFNGGSHGYGALAVAEVESLGEIFEVAITSAGTGYVLVPEVVVSNEGTGADIEVEVDGGIITNVIINNPGTGYENGITTLTVERNAVDAEAVAEITKGRIISHIKNAAGNHYIKTPKVVVSPSNTVGGVDAQAYAVLNGNTVEDIVFTNLGEGYTSLPTVTIERDETELELEAEVTDGRITAVNVINGGSGYFDTPNVKIVGSNTGGTNAIVTAVMSGNSIASINIVDPGSMYTSASAVVERVQNNAAAEIDSLYNVSTGAVSTGTISTIQGGKGYYVTPDVTIEGDGTGATAHAVLVGDTVVQIVIDTPGTGYTFPPVISIERNEDNASVTIPGAAYDGGAQTLIVGQLFTINHTGSGYISVPDVVISGGGGTGAQAIAKINGSGQVHEVEVTVAGSGYTSIPNVTIINKNVDNAVLSVTKEKIGTIRTINVLTPGTGYVLAPTITVTPFVGTTVNATITATPTGGFTIGSSEVTLTNAGEGYLIGGVPTAPTIVVTRNEADANFDVDAIETIGDLKSITVTNIGTGYTQAPLIAIDGDTGTGQATIGVNSGSPYTLDVSSLSVSPIAGGGYTTEPTIEFVRTEQDATLSAIITEGKIISLTLTNPGREYRDVVNTLDFSLPDKFLKVNDKFIYKKCFCLCDHTAADGMAKLYADTIESRLQNVIDTLMGKKDHFLGEEVKTLKPSATTVSLPTNGNTSSNGGATVGTESDVSINTDSSTYTVLPTIQSTTVTLLNNGTEDLLVKINNGDAVPLNAQTGMEITSITNANQIKWKPANPITVDYELPFVWEYEG